MNHEHLAWTDEQVDGVNAPTTMKCQQAIVIHLGFSKGIATIGY